MSFSNVIGVTGQIVETTPQCSYFNEKHVIKKDIKQLLEKRKILYI